MPPIGIPRPDVFGIIDDPLRIDPHYVQTRHHLDATANLIINYDSQEEIFTWAAKNSYPYRFYLRAEEIIHTVVRTSSKYLSIMSTPNELRAENEISRKRIDALQNRSANFMTASDF